MRRLEGKVALVTGGARGIGEGIVRRFVSEGAQVMISDVLDSEGQALADELGQAYVHLDVSSRTEWDAAIAATEAHWGRLDCLVNNAGVLGKQARVTDMSAERLQRVFAINVIGSFLCAREAVQRMSTKNGGSGGAIVNVSSGAARHGAPNEYVDYAASKGAIDTMTLGLSKEVGAEGIRVNAVRPGLIYTDIHAAGGEPGRVDRLSSGVPMQRGGQPDEVARTILWLLSDEASYVTGALVDVTGGR